jgi:hypothetical protein
VGVGADPGGEGVTPVTGGLAGGLANTGGLEVCRGGLEVEIGGLDVRIGGLGVVLGGLLIVLGGDVPPTGMDGSMEPVAMGALFTPLLEPPANRGARQGLSKGFGVRQRFMGNCKERHGFSEK